MPGIPEFLKVLTALVAVLLAMAGGYQGTPPQTEDSVSNVPIVSSPSAPQPCPTTSATVAPPAVPAQATVAPRAVPASTPREAVVPDEAQSSKDPGVVSDKPLNAAAVSRRETPAHVARYADGEGANSDVGSPHGRGKDSVDGRPGKDGTDDDAVAVDRDEVQAPGEEVDATPTADVAACSSAAPTAGAPATSDNPTAPAVPVALSGSGTTAAETFNWGPPNRVDEFDAGTEQWGVYDGPGHAGKGIRSPDQAKVDNGVLTINGTSAGTSAGMAWTPGQKYGRWEGRMRADVGPESYNALLLLWPDAENFPVGGEVDFAEIMSADRQTTNMFLHYGAKNAQISGEVKHDATQWTNWALEWTPKKMTAFVNGKEWWSSTEADKFPPGPMHLCIQLDWFPDGSTGSSAMQVDWVKQYSLDGASIYPAAPAPNAV